jgi:DNA repair exonuclease SbcCD ATPase subunit
MPAFVLVSSAFLVFAVTVELLALKYQPSALVELFFALPLPQQIALLVICLVPLALISAILLQHSRLVEKRKAAEVLETRLRSVRHDVLGLEGEQKSTEHAAEYLDRSDPEGALKAIQARMAGTEQTIQFQHERNQSADLAGCLEQVRQQQQAMRLRLGEVIAKRRSMETSIAQLQSSQDEIDSSISVIDQDKDAETLEHRLQKLSQFVGTISIRCEEIDRSMPVVIELEEKFQAVQRRLSPLEDKKIGVLATLTALADVRDEIERKIAVLERDGDARLEDRLTEFQKLSQFLDATNNRCEKIDRSMPDLTELEENFGALQRRLTPLEQKKTDIIETLKALSDLRDEVIATIARLERDEGVSLEERLGETQKLSQFAATAGTRCDEIDRLLPDLMDLEEKFEILQRRLAPLEHKKMSVIGTLKALSDIRNQTVATIARLERDEDVSLEERLGDTQKLSQFIKTAGTRCEEIDRSLPGLSALEEKFEAVQRRLAPLEQRKSAVIATLKALSDLQNQLNGTIARLEADEGATLDDRIQQLGNIKHGLEERVASVLAQFSAIDAIHKDIADLFGKLNHVRRIPREPDLPQRVVSSNGNGANVRPGDTNGHAINGNGADRKQAETSEQPER